MTGHLLRAALFCFLVGEAACFTAPASAETLALVGGRAYASPDAAGALPASFHALCVKWT